MSANATPASAPASDEPKYIRRDIELNPRGDATASVHVIVEKGEKIAIHPVSVYFSTKSPTDTYSEAGSAADTPAALEEALLVVLAEDLKAGSKTIEVPNFPGFPATQVVVSKDGVKVEEFQNVGCPGMPGFYSAPSWFVPTALAFALAKVVEEQDGK